MKSTNFPPPLASDCLFGRMHMTTTTIQLDSSEHMHSYEQMETSKVPEGHHPRGTTLREALRGNSPLRGLCGDLSEGSAGSLRGFCGVSAGFCGGPRDFPRVPGVVTLCL